MIKPMSGYVVVKLEDVTKSGIIVNTESMKEMIVKKFADDVEGIKKGDSIIVKPNSQVMKITGETDILVLHKDDICAVR